jgi:hypothetical protein
MSATPPVALSTSDDLPGSFFDQGIGFVEREKGGSRATTRQKMWRNMHPRPRRFLEQLPGSSDVLEDRS